MQRAWVVVVVLTILLASAVIFIIEQQHQIQSYQQRQAAESSTASPLSDFLRRRSEEPELAIAIPKFLSLPFPSAVKHTISRGWDLNSDEKERSLGDKNWGIDFALPSGTAILAPADGYALASYHEYSWSNRGKVERGGLGTFVQFFHPQAGLYTQCTHLERVESRAQIPFLQPERSAKRGLPPSWIPGLLMIYMPTDFDLKQYKVGSTGLYQYPHKVFPVEVKRGQIIGYVADGRIYKHGGSQVKATLHFEVFNRGPETDKALRFDPYGLYTVDEFYKDTYSLDDRLSLWLRGSEGKPLHADETVPPPPQ